MRKLDRNERRLVAGGGFFRWLASLFEEGPGPCEDGGDASRCLATVVKG